MIRIIPRVTANDTESFVTICASSWAELYQYLKDEGYRLVTTTSGDYWTQ